MNFVRRWQSRLENVKQLQKLHFALEVNNQAHSKHGFLLKKQIKQLIFKSTTIIVLYMKPRFELANIILCKQEKPNINNNSFKKLASLNGLKKQKANHIWSN